MASGTVGLPMAACGAVTGDGESARTHPFRSGVIDVAVDLAVDGTTTVGVTVAA